MRALWRTPAGQVSGVSWAPDGKTFALTTGSRVVLLERDGSLVRQFRATGAAYLRDGRLAVSRRHGIYLLTGSRSRRLASRQELERVAGFRARRTLSVSHDARGFTRGHGRGAVALTLWSAGRSWKSVVLVVSAAGRVLRASPAYRAGGGEGAVYGWAWSPDGRELFVAAEVAGPPERSRRGSTTTVSTSGARSAGVGAPSASRSSRQRTSRTSPSWRGPPTERRRSSATGRSSRETARSRAAPPSRPMTRPSSFSGNSDAAEPRQNERVVSIPMTRPAAS